MPLFQYQVKAEPVITDAERSTPDKYLPVDAIQIKAPIGAAILTVASALAFVFVPAAENITVDKWKPHAPQRLAAQRAVIAEPYAFVPLVVPGVNSWGSQQQLPFGYKSTSALSYQQTFVPLIVTPSVDKWQPQGTQPQAPRRVIAAEQQTFVALLAPGVDAWGTQSPEIVVRPLRPKPDIASDPFRRTAQIFMSSWFELPSVPRWEVERRAALYQTFAWDSIQIRVASIVKPCATARKAGPAATAEPGGPTSTVC